MLAENIEGFLTGAADFFVNPGGPGLHFLFIQLQRPSPSTMQTPSPMVLRIKCGLLADEGAFEGEEIGGFGEDAGELVGLDEFEGFFDGAGFNDVALQSKGVDRGGVDRGRISQD